MTTDASPSSSQGQARRPRLALRIPASPPARVGVVLVALILVFGFGSPREAFFQYGNFVDMAQAASEALLLAAGMTFVLSVGLLDLSVGANLVLASVCGARTMVALAGTPQQVEATHYPHLALAVVVGIAVCILVAVVFSVVNALIITRLGINSFIATLATTGIGTGIALVVANSADIPYIPESLQLNFANGGLFSVPYPVLIVIVVCLILAFVLRFTRFGMRTQAIGSSRLAAERAGLGVNMHFLRVFILMGVLVGMAAFLDVARFATTNINGHASDALTAIAAVVIGGTSLFGGRASVVGSMIGALIPVVLATGLVIMGLSSNYQLVAVGVVLLVAVFVYQRRSRAA